MSEMIRFAKVEDAEALAKLEMENFDEPWSAKNFADCIGNAQGRVVVFEDRDESQGAKELLGCVTFYYAADEGEIDSVVVKKTARKCGVGGKMLAFLHQEVENLDVHYIFLEVRESNLPAQKLYEKMGYEQVGKRPKFYQNPVEDAYIYRREQ